MKIFAPILRNIFSFFSLIVAAPVMSQTVGLFTQNPGSQDGYVLFAPISSDTTYLIDKCGKKVHTWSSTHHPGQSVYLLEDGTLLRPGATGNPTFNAGGAGGSVEMFDWNSQLTWSYQISNTNECQHHDIHRLPNGNILAIVWEKKTVAEAQAAGRNPSQLGTTLWTEKIIELHPVGTNAANIVWEWHVWDHLVQEYDSTKTNYGIVADHPELINFNYTGSVAGTVSDWIHMNSVDYNPDLDQVMVSSHNTSEIWIIDHSTTTAEAATHAGGVHGRGGDLLYRWGNPAAFNRGTTANQKLFGQHYPHWITTGLRDEKNVMIFNNGQGRPGGNYSSVDIIQLPVDSVGNYALTTGAAYQPDSAYWKYIATPANSFYGMNISGAQRLSNGNTLVCEGPKGNFFEVDTSGTTVWKYVSPVGQNGIVSQGTAPGMNSVFRCTLYEPGYTGFAGQTLVPGNPIELNPLAYTCNTFTGIGELIQKNSTFSVTLHDGELHIIPDEDALNVCITLYDVTGRKLQQWDEVNLYANESTWLNLQLDDNPGVYLLTIHSVQTNDAIRIMQQ